MALLPTAVKGATGLAGGFLKKGAGVVLGTLALGGGVLAAENITDNGQGGVVLKWAQNQAKKLIESSSTEQGRNAVIDGYYGGVGKFASIGGWFAGLFKMLGMDNIAEAIQNRFNSTVKDINKQAVDFKNEGDVFKKGQTPNALTRDGQASNLETTARVVGTPLAAVTGMNEVVAGGITAASAAGYVARKPIGKLLSKGKAGDAPDTPDAPKADTPDSKAGLARAAADAPDVPKTGAPEAPKTKIKGGRFGKIFTAATVTLGVAATAATYSPQSQASELVDPNKAADIPQTGTEYLKQEGGNQVFEAVTDAIPFGEAVKSYMDGNTAEALDSAVADTGGLVGAFALGAGAGAAFGGVGAIPGALIAGGGYMIGEYVGDKIGDATITEAVADKFDSVADPIAEKLSSMKDSLVNWFNDEADPQTELAQNYKQPAPAWNLN